MNIVISLFSIAFLPSATADTQQYYISGSECTFFYQLPNQQEFIFIKCSVINQQIYDWYSCIRKCCYSETDMQTQMRYETLQACQVKQNSGQAKIIIAIAVLSSIILFCIVCKIVMTVCNNCNIHCLCCCPVKRLKEVEVTSDWAEQKDVNTKLNNIQWSTLSCPKLKIGTLGQICCICLEKDITAELVCGHHFHPNCLNSWLRKNLICPVCRHENIRSVKVYCSSCLWKYFVCHLSLLLESSWSLPSKCEGCNVKKSRKGSEEFINESKLHFNLDRTSTHSNQHEIE